MYQHPKINITVLYYKHSLIKMIWFNLLVHDALGNWQRFVSTLVSIDSIRIIFRDGETPCLSPFHNRPIKQHPRKA